jgi:hypothetical protein
MEGMRKIHPSRATSLFPINQRERNMAAVSCVSLPSQWTLCVHNATVPSQPRISQCLPRSISTWP